MIMSEIIHAPILQDLQVIFGGNDLKRSFKSVHVLQRSGTGTVCCLLGYRLRGFIVT